MAKTKKKSFVGEQLRKAAGIYDERNALYGDNYLRFGFIMERLFPDGLKIKTADDWNRLGMFVQASSKFTRYAANWDRGGHPDSLDDLSVYAQMLQEVDHLIANSKIDEFIDKDAQP